MFGDLGKKLEEVFADVNPFDNGATGATVRANRAKVPPARTVSAPRNQATTQFKPIQSRPLTLNNVQATSPVRMPTMKQPQVAPQPQVKQPAPTGPSLNDVAKFLVGGSAKTANTAIGGISLAGNAIGQAADQVLFNGQHQKNYNKNAERINSSYLKPGSGLLGVGGVMDSKQFATAAPQVALGKGAASGAQTAAELYAPSRGMSLVSKTLPLSQKVSRGALEGAITGVVGNSGAQLLDTGTINPLEAGLSGLTGSVLGGGIPVLGHGAKAAGNAYVNAAEKLVNRPMPNIPQSRLLTEGGYIKLPRKFGNIDNEKLFSKESPLKPAHRKLIKQEVDADIMSDPNVASAIYGGDDMYRSLIEGGGPELPSIHVDDLKHYMGNLTEDFPRNLRRKSGKRDVDELAATAGFDDPAEFIQAIQDRVDSKRFTKDISKEVNNRRMDESIRQSAIDRLNSGQSIAGLNQEWKDALTDRIRVKGQKAVSKEYKIPVSTRETRRKSIKVTGPAKNAKGQEFVVANTLDDNGKPTFELVPLDKKKHTLSNGRVVDKDGRVVGSYLGVDESGQQFAYVEGKPVNITGVLGDLDKWGNQNKSSWDMERLIEANAPDAATAKKTQKFVTRFKDQQEAMMKAALKQRRDALAAKEKATNKALPFGKSKKNLTKDLFRAAEGKADINQLRQEYGDKFIDEHFIPAINWSRDTYDELLTRANNSLQRNGFDPIPARKNYITHILDEPNFWQKVGIGIQDLNPMGGSVSSDINPGRARGGVPDEIVGRTSNTGARRKFNRFAQERKGNNHAMDFWAAHDAYYEPILHNEYMTPAASRARVVERAFRTNDKAKELQKEEFAQIVGQSEANKQMVRNRNHKNFKADRRSPLVMAWQEYGNMLAGKTNAIDRTVIDNGGKGGEALLNASTKAQGIAGASSIPGSTTAAIAQVLSLPQTIARDSQGSVLRAAKDMLTFEGKRAGANDPLRKSAFMRARYTDAESQRLSTMRKYTKGASVPMQAIERVTGELSWRSAYHEALKKKLTGQEAIDYADLAAKKTLAGRGIGDRPLVMNSKALGLFTQFGLEVNNSRIQFWNDFTPWQKTKFLVAAAALNQVYQGVTGNAPLPDYIKGINQSVADFSNSEDDKKDTPWDNTVQAGQRLFGESSKFVPGASTITGLFMNDRTREEVFGKNGDLSRFGTPALSKVITAPFDAAGDIAKGDFGNAALTGASLAPTGTQVKRTIQGGDAAIKGYVTDSKGNVTSVNDKNNPFTVPQALAFGKNSLPGQQQANQSGFKLSEKESTYFKKMYAEDPVKATEYFNKTIKNKIKASDRKGTLTNVGSAPSASAASMPDAPYGVQPTNKTTTTSTSENKANVAKATTKTATDLLEEFDAMPDEEHKDWNAAKNTNPAILKSLSSWTGGKVDVKDITNETARKWAEYQKDFADGKTTKITQDKTKKEILASALKSSLDDTESAIYSMSKDSLESYMDAGDIKQNQVDKILAVEKAQYDAGIISKEEFARKLGKDARGYKGRGGRSGKGKFDYKLDGFSAKGGSANSDLRNLLKKATLKGTVKRKRK